MSLRARVDVPGRLRAAIEAEAGDVVAVVGPNGAGKTTLLRALAGLLSAEGTSEVEVDGRSWTSPWLLPRERGVGHVVQGQALFPHLSALENAAFGPSSRGASRAEARRRAQHELDRLGVGELARRRPHQLSGGQAQRVAIARALATDPALLLLDEPFAGLDVGVAARLRAELRRHLADFAGVTLLVTHDALDALTLASRVVVLQDGAVVQVGSAADVAAHPRSEHVAHLVGLNLLRLASGELAAFRPSAVTLSTARPEGSARWAWRGTVTDLTPYGDGVRVALRLHDAELAEGPDGAQTLLADVTPMAVAELGLVVDAPLWASTKETALRRYANR